MCNKTSFCFSRIKAKQARQLRLLQCSVLRCCKHGSSRLDAEVTCGSTSVARQSPWCSSVWDRLSPRGCCVHCCRQRQLSAATKHSQSAPRNRTCRSATNVRHLSMCRTLPSTQSNDTQSTISGAQFTKYLTNDNLTIILQ